MRNHGWLFTGGFLCSRSDSIPFNSTSLPLPLHLFRSLRSKAYLGATTDEENVRGQQKDRRQEEGGRGDALEEWTVREDRKDL